MTEPIFEFKTEKKSPDQGVFVLSPLATGYGLTLGNALRRVLLSSLPGAAVTFVKIAGARHSFATLPGLKEDIVQFIFNVKKLRIRLDVEGPVKITLDASGPGVVTAAQIKTSAGVEVINKDLILGNLADKKSKLSCEMTVENGFGYSPFEERKSETLGVIPIDATFSPIVRVNYNVETARVGRVANYDALSIEVATDGTITPEEALKESAKILVSYFQQVIEPKTYKKEKESNKSKVPADALKLTVEELSLPTRITNALEKNGFKTAADLVGEKRKEIVRIKNLGQKSIKIIDVALAEKGVETPEK
ncbi:MAG: DNA-directed RNA polymerase subunit alpha [bacterium]|nr:DNA-directed RNA polymerase subunit alpha [bacterium]